MIKLAFKPRGFTLIELLITVSIIAILSAIGFVVYSNVLKQGRDSKRQSDLRSIQSALEQYNSDQGFYPFSEWMNGSPTCGLDDLIAGYVSCGTSFTNLTGNLVYVPVTKTYMNSLPQDPTGTARYKYQASPGTCIHGVAGPCTSYCLYAKLENPPSPVPSPPTGCTYPAGYNFAVTPP